MQYNVLITYPQFVYVKKSLDFGSSYDMQIATDRVALPKIWPFSFFSIVRVHKAFIQTFLDLLHVRRDMRARTRFQKKRPSRWKAL